MIPQPNLPSPSSRKTMAKISSTLSLPPSLLHSIFLILLLGAISKSHSATLLNVLDFGGRHTGDWTVPFRRAWAAACSSSESAIVYIPKGRYVVRPTIFHGGGCENGDISFHIDGALVAPADYRILGGGESWLSFEGVDGVSVSGGVLDANGAALWACKSSAAAHCPVGAMVPASSSSYSGFSK